jgi:hypothetical protein
MIGLAKDRVPRARRLKDGTINTVASVGQYRGPVMLAETAAASVPRAYDSANSATRVDIALLASMLFLQRFSLPVGRTFIGLELVAIGLILSYQFFCGKLMIQYDRLLWFLPFALAITCSLLLNFKSDMLTGYFQFMVFNSLFTLIRPSTSDQYKRALEAFQFIMMLLSCLAVAQFFAQFVVDGRQLGNFYGIFPDVLFGFANGGGLRTVGTATNGLIRSNGLFLGEPSGLSQMTALGILIEVLEFRRPRYLVGMALGFLVAYSGTGLMLLLLFLPLAGLRHGRAALSALLVAIFALGLFATGIIDLSAFLDRAGEFQDTHTSGFARFVSPFLLAAKDLDTGSLQALVIGSGPGTAKTFGDPFRGGGSLVTWFKLFYEYGMIGSFMFCCFLASCLSRSRCPGVVVAAMIFAYVFLQGTMTITIVLCTLHGPEPRRGRLDEASRYGRPLVADTVAG